MIRKRPLTILLILTILAHPVYGQDREVLVTENFYNKPLSLVLGHLKINYRVTFEYEEGLLEGITISQKFRKIPLNQVMEMLLQDTELQFQIAPGYKVSITPRGTATKVIPRKIIEPTRTNISVTGVVKEAGTGESLPNALILIKGAEKGTSSNLDGHFTLLDVPTDTTTLIVRYIGFETQEIQLDPEIAAEPLEVELSTGSTQLQEVIIQAERDLMMQVSGNVSQVALSPAKIATLPSLGERDIFRSFQLLPGVSGTNETSSGLFVRGGTPDQNLILFDGFTVYHVDHFYGFFSAFNSNAIKDVQLYKGGFEAKYGGRISSVVEMTGKTGNVNDFSLSAGISSISGNTTAEIPIAKGKGSILIAGRRSYTDIIQSGLYNDVNDLFNQENDGLAQNGPGAGRFLQNTTEPSFFFYDFNGKVTYKPSQKDVLSFSVYNGQDNLDNSREVDNNSFGGGGFPGGGNVNFNFNNDTEDLLKWGNWGVSTKWSRQWNQRFYSNAVVAYSNYFSQRDRFSITEITVADSTRTIQNGFEEDNDLKDISFRLDNEVLISQNNQLEFGAQITSNDITYSYIQNDTTTVLDRDDQGLISAFYLQDKWTVFEHLSITLGGRVTHYDVTSQFYFEPRASFSYQLTNRIKLKGAWGNYYQFATRIVREDITQGSRDFWLLADDEINPIAQSTHYIAGISYETGPWLFDIEAYDKDMTGLSEYTLRFVGTRGRAGGGGPGGVQSEVDELFFEGTGEARGIEFLLQRKAGKFTGWLGYTLSEVIHDFPELSDEPFPALHDQRHEFKIVNSVKLGRWDLSGTWVYGSGKPYTAPIGGYELTLLDGSIGNYISVGEKNAIRLPAYHRMDLSATYNFYMGQAKSNLGLSVFNFYNHTNIWYKEFEIIEDEIIETNVNYLGFTPSLFFNIKF